jgi:CRISPR/Cas system-associated protein Cas5 (RAMP superfamily)
MEKPIEIVALILLGIAILLGVYFLLSKAKPNITPGEELNKACLEILKNGCKESEVSIEGKSFEDICRENGLNLDECKKYCGCER